ncbi:MAG: hypothetical protein O3A47_11335 [Chloroflexi bacterium]|nr:hypothetical protein [Chloroflexota bacterium]
MFGDVPSEPEALRRHRRAKLTSTMAIAFVLYGVGVHVTDAIEVFSREHEGITDGSVYDLVYFLDEGLSHYFQFFPFFFVMGWFLIYDRPGRTAYPYLAIFFGVAHGVERTVGIIEGEKWFLGPAAFAWMAFAAWLRWRRVGPGAATEFFFKHAVAFCLTVPVTLTVYYTRFDSFPPPSGLSQGRLAEVWVGSVLVTVVCTAAVVLDRWWSRRRAGLAT